MMRLALSAVAVAVALNWTPVGRFLPWSSAEARNRTGAEDAAKPGSRAHAIARAQVWAPTRIAALDIKAGPKDPGAFPFHATITCDYLPKSLGGASPKFACERTKEDELKVKYGGNNAEVYAEVAATRLLWALGFGADRMYPVRVICRGCPREFGGIERVSGDAAIFDPASIERKMPGRELGDEGWSWAELDAVNEEAGGAPRAHRDALKLLAVFMQHTDSKPVQQRLLCLDETKVAAKEKAAAKEKGKQDAACARPFMMVSDVGLTFGRANTFNANNMAMNLVAWSATPVWKDATACVGNLPKSLTGTLDNPVISEEGRRFLAGLLTQLSDAQIRDLFEVARVSLRAREPGNARAGFGTPDEWADAFKQKRSEIVNRRCA